MRYPSLFSVLCSAIGFFGWFGVAHFTRLRLAKPLFYVLSMLFAGNVLAAVNGYPFSATILHDAIVCMSGIAAITYAVLIERYWRQRK